MITKIKLKRTSGALSTVQEASLDYGEPLYANARYIAVGTETENGKVGDAYACKLHSQERVDKGVFFNGESNEPVQLTDDQGNELRPIVPATTVQYYSNVAASITSAADALNLLLDAAPQANKIRTENGTQTNYYLLGIANTDADDYYKQVYHAGSNPSAAQNTGGIYFTSTGVLMGAAWNDYAETRKCAIQKPGTCVIEVGDGTLKPSDGYLLPGANIISDTYGMCIGEKEDEFVPIAVSGRVLAYVENKEQLKPGDALKTAPDGKLAKMTRREIRKYPDRIVGYVSEFPSYEKWNDLEVDGRIWIKVN